MSGETGKEQSEQEILESLPEEIRKEAKKLSPDVLAALTISIRQSWSGPLPPPEVFKKYPAAVQKAIVAQADAQLKHRQQLEKKVVSSNINAGRTGMRYAFWITVILIGTGAFLIASDHSVAGLVAILTPTAFVGSNFIIQKWREIRKIGKDSSNDNDAEVRPTDE